MSSKLAMKLKQRVIVTGSLFLTMVLLFTIGMQLSWPDPSERDKEQSRSSPPDRQPQIKPHLDVHTPKNNESQRPSPPLHLPRPHLPAGLNMSELGLVGDWPPPGPRRMLKDRLNLKLPQLGRNIRGSKRVDELSIPAEIAELNPWAIWRGWVQQNSLYPKEVFNSDEMNHILATMAMANITSFGLGSRGTQLKATVMLGTQKTVFKPKRSGHAHWMEYYIYIYSIQSMHSTFSFRYARDTVIGGDPYAGFDRHTGEIAGFHLDGCVYAII